MKKSRVWIIIVCMSLSVFVTSSCAVVKNDAEVAVESYPLSFELTDGDRVVFLGNSLFEYDLRYGYLEFALTSRFPGQDIIFRNLGWSGDTVFGESRGYFTTPPDPYDHLIKQLTDAQPTIVFISYGAVESLEGEEGIAHFHAGLNQLLDEINNMDAEAILLSPIPQLPAAPPLPDIQPRNDQLQRYSASISETAVKRDLHFIDLFNPLNKIGQDIQLTDNGIHLNEIGYYYLASEIEKSLGLPSRNEVIEISLESERYLSSDQKITELKFIEETGLGFTLKPDILPLPIPDWINHPPEEYYTIKISGLEEGMYSLSNGDGQVIKASAHEWSEGVDIQNGAPFRQATQLRDLIVEKNDLFFQQYRPQNRTYLIGFRSHEQGHLVRELHQLDLFISRKEDQISQLRMPEPVNYQLTSIR